MIVLPAKQIDFFLRILSSTLKLRTLINLETDLKNGLAYLLKTWNFVCALSLLKSLWAACCSSSMALKMVFATYLPCKLQHPIEKITPISSLTSLKRL